MATPSSGSSRPVAPSDDVVNGLLMAASMSRSPLTRSIRKRISTVEVWRDAAALNGWRAQADPPSLDLEMRDLTMTRFDAVEGGPLFP